MLRSGWESRRLKIAWIAVLLSGVVACSDVPREAVTLSVTVGKDLEDLHRSHRALATEYFARMTRDVNSFIETVYRPALLNRYFRETRYPVNVDGRFEPDPNEAVAKLPVLDIISAEVQQPGTGEAVEFLAVVVEEAMAQVDRKRDELLKPIIAQEQTVIKSITDAYTNVINGHSLVTAHLASIRKVQQAQDQFLSDIGLADVRTKFIDATVSVSERVSDALEGANRARESVESLDARLEKVKSAVTSWPAKLGGEENGGQ
jgi:hypothetical protein